MAGRSLRIAVVHYGEQGGVGSPLCEALAARGHAISDVPATGDLDPRARPGAPRRVTPALLRGVASAALRFGRGAFARRWNTPYAFGVHSERARRSLAALAPPPDVVLQRGALFAPGIPPPFPYVLVCDFTGALAARGEPGAGRPPEPGGAWRAREAAVYAGARAVCTSSRRTAESVAADYGIDPARVHVVGAGASEFPADPPPRADDGRTILLLAKDPVAAGAALVVEAFRRLQRTHHFARLLVATTNAADRSSARLPLPHGAAHARFVAPDERAALYAQSTLFVLPAAREPFPLPLLAAMAGALPCVAPRAGVTDEVVEDGRTGLLVPDGDPEALAAAFAALLDAPSRARAMGEAGRRAVEAKWRWEHVAARLEPILGRAAAGGGPAHRVA